MQINCLNIKCLTRMRISNKKECIDEKLIIQKQKLVSNSIDNSY